MRARRATRWRLTISWSASSTSGWLRLIALAISRDVHGSRFCSFGQPDNVLGDGPIVAALSPDFAATHDGRQVTLWNIENSGWQLLDGPGAPQRLAIASGSLLVTWANRTTSLHTLLATPVSCKSSMQNRIE